VKYLLVLLVIFVVAWRWRAARLTDQSAAQRKRAATEPTAMLQCAHCAVHIPAKEATQGQRGVYCCEAHRALAES
jgi:uncharacterized protein